MERLLVGGIAVCWGCLVVVAKEPDVPPGAGTSGGVMVALLGRGIDYRLPELKGRLARDGEGDLIAWDFSDNDTKPFAEGPLSGTDLAVAIASLSADVRLVVVKEASGDPQALGRMMSFAAQTPARIVVWTDADPARPDWPILREAIGRFSDLLFVLPVVSQRNGRSYAGLRAGNTLIAASVKSAADVRLTGGFADLGVGFGPHANLTELMMYNAVSSVTIGMATRALVEAPTLSLVDLKKRLVARRPKGLATAHGFVALDDVRRFLLTEK